MLSYVIDQLSLIEGDVPEQGDQPSLVRLRRGIEAGSITDPRFWRKPVSPTFHGRDIFAPVAAGLSLGLSPYEFGEKTEVLVVLPITRPQYIGNDEIAGHVLHVDRFGNLVTDIRGSSLPPGPVAVFVGNARIDGISRYYEETERLGALIGSSGYVEISLREGNAAQYLGVYAGDEVRVMAVS